MKKFPEMPAFKRGLTRGLFQPPKFKQGPNPFMDSDKDGYPDLIDCQPFNPKKQGFLGDMVDEYKTKRHLEQQGIEVVEEPQSKAYHAQSVSHSTSESTSTDEQPKKPFTQKLQELGQTYREYKKESGERKLTSLTQQAKIEEQRAKIQSSRFGMQKQRLELENKQQELFNKRGNSFGGNSILGSFPNVPQKKGTSEEKKKSVKRRVKRRATTKKKRRYYYR